MVYHKRNVVFMPPRHEKPGYIMVMVMTVIVLIITLFFNFLQFIAEQDDVGLFSSNISYVSKKYNLDITPADWTFSIWAFIYIFQVAWVIYAHTLLCRVNKFKTGLLYFDPPFLPPAFFVVYTFCLILNVTWLFAFDSEFLVAAYIIIISMCLFLKICMFFSFKLLWTYEKHLTKTEMWLNIVLVQNGIGLFCTWIEVAALLNSGIVFHYKADLSMYITCIMALIIALVAYIFWFCLDVFYATTSLRYHLAPYVVVLIAITGVLDKNWDSSSDVQALAAVVAGVSGVGLLGKIVSIVVYNYTKPLSIEQ